MFVCWFRSVCLHLRVVSGCLWEALFNQQWKACVWEFINWLHRKSDLALRGRETDSASTVIRLVLAELRDPSRTADDVLMAYAPCGLHQSNLNVGGYVKEWHHKLVLSMHAHASLLRTGNFWLRTILAIEDFVANSLVVVRGEPGLRIFCVAKTTAFATTMCWFHCYMSFLPPPCFAFIAPCPSCHHQVQWLCLHPSMCRLLSLRHVFLDTRSHGHPGAAGGGRLVLPDPSATTWRFIHCSPTEMPSASQAVASSLVLVT